MSATTTSIEAGTESPVLGRARQLHDRAVVIDTHNDSIVAHIRRGNLNLTGEPGLPGSKLESLVAYLRGPADSRDSAQGVQLNFPYMREAGIACAFFAVDVTRAIKNHLVYALDAFGFLLHNIQSSGPGVRIAYSHSDIEEAKQAGELSVILVLENSDGLERSLNSLVMLYQMGLRVIGFTHDTRSWAGDGTDEAGSHAGLSPFGRRLVKEMNQLRMLIDVSHLNDAGFWDVIELSTAPVIASHSCCRALCAHPRNLTDEQIRAVARAGGVICPTLVPAYVDEHKSSLQRFTDHLEHVIAIASVDHVGIGSDFDGGGTLLATAASYPMITAELLDRGHDDAVISKILGGNVLRLLRRVIG